jgi:trehalose 6-phosphate phosphatase
VYASASDGDNAEVGDLASRVAGLIGSGRAGLATDVDGTISPIARRPDEAIVLPAARRALEGLKHRLTVVAILTGRSVGDARRMVDVDGLTYIGNHGMELWGDAGAEMIPEARPWVPHVAAVLDGVAQRLDPALTPGVIAENKGASASLHYRLTPDPDYARRTLLQILKPFIATSGLRVEEGRQVINLLPPLMVTKGSAAAWLVRQNALERFVYIGDDMTDAHAFREMRMMRASGKVKTLAIGVVGPETPQSVRQLADASVPSAAAVARLLSEVLEQLVSSDSMGFTVPNVGSD